VTEAVADFSRRARTERGWWVAAGLVVFGLLYPFLVETLQSLPVIGNFVPTTGSMVVMLILTMMALGLNIVVGYAGLLDLGYVAFYAAGAYVAAWLASLSSTRSRCTSAPRSTVTCPGSTSRCGSC